MNQDRTAAWAGAVCLLAWLAGAPLVAQEPLTAGAGKMGTLDAAATPPADGVVPRLVRFTGIIDPRLVREDSAQQTEPRLLAVTFSLYREREGGAPLWSETQAVTLDAQGHYVVLLGATQPDGLPLDLFTSGQAKWLGVAPAVPGVGEKSRVLLVGVPYALKAADADTLGGLPASAFLHAGQGSGNLGAAGAPGLGPISGAPGGGTPSPAGQTQPKGKGPQPNAAIADYLPYWNGTSNAGNSAIYQSGSNLGIGTTVPGNLLDLQGGGIFRVGGSASPGYPKAGQGFEVAFNSADGAGGGSGSGVALFQSYSRDAKLWRDLWVRGLNTEFDANGTAAMYLASTGNVGLGTTSPGSLLDLQGGGILRVGGSASPGYPKAGQGFEVAFNSADGAGGGSGSGVAVFQSYSRDAKLWRDVWVRGLNTEFDADGTAAMYLASGGNVGVGTTTPAAKLEVNGTSKFDQAVTFAAGQTFPGTATLGANTFAGNQMVTGNVSATESGSGSAVYGANTATSGSTVGVEGMASSPMGAGLLGRDASASTTGSQHPGYTGVWGDTGVAGNDGVLATADDGFAMVAYNNSPSLDATLFAEALNSTGGPIIKAVSGTNSCYIDTDANLFCTGSKSAVVPVDDGRYVALYAVEAPENWFEDFGSAALVQGVAKVTLEPVFAQTVNAGMEYHVFLTPKGDCEGLFVTNETPGGFEVHELRHGQSNVAFDYRIVARRKGYENVRLADKTKEMNAPRPNSLRERRSEHE